MHRIAIIGAGALGQQIAHLAQLNNREITGFFDDFSEKDSKINGKDILGKINEIDSCSKYFDALIIGIGYKHFSFREKLFNHLSTTHKFATIIDRTAIIDESASIEEGSVVMPGAVIGQNVRIRKNVFINISATIAHDSRIASHSFIAPSVAVAGNVDIGERCFIGLNSTIIDGVHICSDCKVGGGTVVINDVERPGLYVGNPARFVR